MPCHFVALGRLASDLLSFNDRHPDTWCVQAMYWDMKGDRDKALQLVSRVRGNRLLFQIEFRDMATT